MQDSNTATQIEDEIIPQLDTAYHSILMAVDSSDHSNRATDDAIELGQLYQSTITASHVYAAQMHDMRFKQMEGGLPEQFKEEDELERQRDIHDSLITKGLSIITDSYLIQAENACKKTGLIFKGRSLEGKNYKILVNEANNGHYDLLVMGSLGLGAIAGSTIGTVCERVVRRSTVDTLVIKQPQRSIKDGPIVAAIDGSKQSYAALITAFNLARQWQLPLKVVSAFDPYYHYVAFNKIAGVLSDEAGKVFKFKEQEQLHEEIIDDGLAKIYQGHLDVAEQMAEERGIEIETHLLSGKPHHAIEEYIDRIKASLLIIGKIGIHCDDELDIGGNSENLLRNSSCALLLTQREFTPPVELIAETTTTWSTQSEEAMRRIPPFVQNMARATILRYAQAEGHTVITASIVHEATKNMCPAGMKNLDNLVDAATAAKQAKESKSTAGAFNMDWSAEADEILQQVQDNTLRNNTKMRAEKRALTEKSTIVEVDHILPFVVNPSLKKELPSPSSSKCPFSSMGKLEDSMEEVDLPWHQDALTRLEKIPEGTSRNMTKKAANAIAQQQNIETISLEFLENILSIFNSGSKKVIINLTWTKDAEAAIAKAPSMVQGMLVQEIEAFAKRENLTAVGFETVQLVKKKWTDEGYFHLDPDDSRSSSPPHPDPLPKGEGTNG
ncbi:MAG: universal stress protein [gamma proteobacterium symbiont of Taylorina sp.]|nr:universal stress protein [gamma proteobacterium symbiont of Taylorina sp.]